RQHDFLRHRIPRFGTGYIQASFTFRARRACPNGMPQTRNGLQSLDPSLETSQVVRAKMNAMGLRFMEEVRRITESFWIEATVAAMVVIEAILDEATIVDTKPTVDQDLIVFWRNR